MNADGDIVVADGFDRFLDFNLLLVEVDVILFLGSVTDIFPGNGSEDFAAFADFNGNRKFYFLELAGQYDGFIRSDLSLMLSRSFLLLGIVDIFRRARRSSFTGQEEIAAIAFGDFDDISFFPEFLNIF